MEKKYLNGFSIKEITFNDGGSILNVSGKLDKIIEELKSIVNDGGYVNFSISKRKEADKHGYTHYAMFKPYEKKTESKPPDTNFEEPKEKLPF